MTISHWLAQVFSHPDPAGLLLIAGKTTVIYLFLIAGLRLLGKRQLGQMTIYDLVLIIVLANAVQNAMVGEDTTLVGGLVSATTLLALNRLFTLIVTRSDRMERFMVGNPVLLLNDGALVPDHLRREGVTREQVMAALHEHGLDSFEQVHMCVLEVDGTISVVPKEAEVFQTRRHFKGLRLS